MLANPLWRQLRERAEESPGDKKHVKGFFRRVFFFAQFNTAHKGPGCERIE
jgi:hypothetical protein